MSQAAKIKLFFIVNALASIGLNIGVIGVNWFIIDVTHQNSILGLYGALSLISAFLTLAWGSSLTDKYNKISLLKYCCFGQGLIFILTGLLYYAHFPALYIIYGLAVLNMPLIVIFSTVSRGAVPTLWDKENLSKGNSALEITIQVGAMLAALLTGVLYKYAGFSLLLFVGAALAVLAGAMLAFSKHSFEYRLPEKEAFFSGLKKGFSYLCQNHYLFLYGVVVFIPTIVISTSNTVIPGYVEQTLRQGPIVYGIGDMCFAVGALLAGFIAPRLAKRFVEEKTSLLFSGLGLLSLGVLGIWHHNILFFLCVFIAGIALAGLRILLNTTFMKLVHEQFLGRVLSLLMALSIAIQAILSFAIGKIMDIWGACFGFIPLLLLLILGLTFLLFQKNNNPDY